MKTNLNLTYISLAISAMTLAACSAVNDQEQTTAVQEQSVRSELVAVESAETDSIVIVSEKSGQPPVSSSKAKAEEKNVARLIGSQQLMLESMSGASAPPAGVMVRTQPALIDRENYQHTEENGLTLASEQPVSTFSIDVDTGSYSNVRRFLNQGQLPRQDAVRVEELVNYFNYGYEAPKDNNMPFAVYTELAPSPWRADSLLLHIGLKGYEIDQTQLPPANLVFLIDVSGSMRSANKIGLLKQGFKLLTKQLRPQDTISIAVYAGASGVVLEPTSGDQKYKILSAIDSLQAGGSTNGAAGINLAYQLAASKFKTDGINRVILATDGDFNVGTVNFDALIDLVEEKRKGGIALTTLGFGAGNYNDHLMEQLADKGNGNYAYIDNLQEARKVLVEEMGSTLQTIAKDVKVQFEFNPNVVSTYRLIGYENRALKREDFNNDKVDAGDIGAGHTVTAIYELDLVGADTNRLDPLRYGDKTVGRKNKLNGEVGFLKLRYKQPNANNSELISTPIFLEDKLPKFAQASDQFKFSAAVAAFGQLLRGGKYLGDMNYDDIVNIGLQGKGADQWGYRSEFINLVRLAKTISE